MNFKVNETAQKLRGGYYTPLDLAEFLAKWVLENKPKRILEPSCGDGIFLEAIERVSHGVVQTVGFELDPQEASKSNERARTLKNVRAEIKCEDFLQWYVRNLTDKQQFDAVVGNPPFIRYQYLPENAQRLAELIFKQHHLPFTKHTNAWVPFIIASLDLLRPGGRLAMVVPSEILHVLHAQSLRSYLGVQCKKIMLFDPEELWFEGTLQGAVLILAEKKLRVSDRTDGLGIISTRGRTFLEKQPSSFANQACFINGKTVAGKWTRALLTKSELELFDTVTSLDCVHQFSDIAKVDVGLVTGANDFFLVNDETVKSHKLEQWSHPMFGRSAHCPGVIYDDAQHSANAKSGYPSNFLWFNVDDKSELPPHVLEYLAKGEKDALHKRYKCSVRRPWYKVPSVYTTKIGMLKRAHNIPKLIFNQIEALTTDTAYRITTSSCDPKKLVYCFINSLTALSSELEGRHYGGGVLELVPSEIERLVVPIPSVARVELRKLDQAIRGLSATDLLTQQDGIILRGLGLSGGDQETIRGAWNRLRNRRQRSSSQYEL